MKTTIREAIHIVVIGAGAGGVKTALLLAESGYRVTLLEARDKPGVPEELQEEKRNQQGIATSWINPGRAGHGFHYIDLNTGKMLMEATIGLYRQYPEIPIGNLHTESHPLRKGRYFITKDSLFEKEQILAIYLQLQKHYRWLVHKDPADQVLGHPDNFFRILGQDEYKEFVNVDKVNVGIETTERLINPVLLSRILFQRVKEEKNITLLTGKKVTKVEYGKDKTFVVSLQDKSFIEADQVINCAWEDMEAIDQTIGLFDVSTNSTNRLKVLAMVRLPQELSDQHSMFFCMGPFCMFSNLGDGTGILTFAPITNVANYQDSKISDEGRRLLAGKATLAEINHYGESIIKGVSQWIPAMAKAQLITVRFGIVKTYGDVDIFDPRSAVHSRAYFGVDSKQIGYINNACMKLVNLNENAQLVMQQLTQHLDTELKIKTLSNRITQEVKDRSTEAMKLFLNHYLRRQFVPNDFASEEKIEKLEKSLMINIKNKKELLTTVSSMPKDYPVHQLFMYLAVCKMLPKVPAEVIADYCEESKIIQSSQTTFPLWTQFLIKFAKKPLVIQVSASRDDLSLLVKSGKKFANRSYSMFLWKSSPKVYTSAVLQSRTGLYH
jgi:hypothetical protein